MSNATITFTGCPTCAGPVQAIADGDAVIYRHVDLSDDERIKAGEGAVAILWISEADKNYIDSALGGQMSFATSVVNTPYFTIPLYTHPPAQPTKLEDAVREVDVALVERLRNRAAQEREIAKNSARVAELLAPELVLFKAREGHYNIYATRMAINHRDNAKKDAAFADDLETAADKLTAALQENAK